MMLCNLLALLRTDLHNYSVKNGASNPTATIVVARLKLHLVAVLIMKSQKFTEIKYRMPTKFINKTQDIQFKLL